MSHLVFLCVFSLVAGLWSLYLIYRFLTAPKKAICLDNLFIPAVLGIALPTLLFLSLCDYQSGRMEKAFKSECKFFLEAIAKGGEIPKELAAGGPAGDFWERIYLINKKISGSGYNRGEPFRKGILERSLMALPIMPRVVWGLYVLLLVASFFLYRYLDRKKSFVIAYSIILFVFVVLSVISSAQMDMARFDQEYNAYNYNIGELIDNVARLERQDGVKYFRKYLLATAEGRLSVHFLNEVLEKYLESENKEWFLLNLQSLADEN